MRLSLASVIALLASALSFLFAYMTEGMGLLPVLFTLAALGFVVWVAIIALRALCHFILTHSHHAPQAHPSGPSTEPSQKPENGVISPPKPGC